MLKLDVLVQAAFKAVRFLTPRYWALIVASDLGGRPPVAFNPAIFVVIVLFFAGMLFA